MRKKKSSGAGAFMFVLLLIAVVSTIGFAYILSNPNPASPTPSPSDTFTPPPASPTEKPSPSPTEKPSPTPTPTPTPPSPTPTLSPDEAYVKNKAAEVIAEICKAGDDDEKKVRKIYAWVRNHVGYVAHGEHDNLYGVAYTAFTEGRGDCYSFYAVARVLLDAANVENMEIRRLRTSDTQTNHWWNLVKINGKWYHSDTTPHKDKAATPLFTEKTARDLTKSRGGNYYYIYDATLYPEVTYE